MVVRAGRYDMHGIHKTITTRIDILGEGTVDWDWLRAHDRRGTWGYCKRSFSGMHSQPS